MPLRFLTAGESHGPALVTILDGMISGLPLVPEVIDRELARRQIGFGAGGRMKIEKDTVLILGGVLDGHTTGAPISMLVQNDDHIKWKGKPIAALTTPRPGHADLTGAVKYGYRDLRPTLERSSARETTMRVAAGAVCKHFLSQFGIVVGGFVRAIGEISADLTGLSYDECLVLAEKNDVRCPDIKAADLMRERIAAIIRSKDTLGGILEIVVQGMPIGLGSYSQWDKRLEARLGSAILSVQAMKGVEFGDAWENARMPGTKAHDAILVDDDMLIRPTNRAGGIEGGISNGQPLVIRVAMKPIATTLTPQITVDLSTGRQGPTKYERSDFCPVPRAVPILEAMVSYVIADALLEKLGGDSLGEILPRYEALRKSKLSDLPMDNIDHVFWD
ncbi:MAG: chorismate synthase [Chloroflexi bacterium]|nr:chorismate synthase [Chloroflexota bacterium]